MLFLSEITARGLYYIMDGRSVKFWDSDGHIVHVSFVDLPHHSAFDIYDLISNAVNVMQFLFFFRWSVAFPCLPATQNVSTDWVVVSKNRHKMDLTTLVLVKC